MLRTKNEIRDRAVIDDIIHRSLVCRLAMVDGLSPYVVPWVQYKKVINGV